MNEQNMDIGVRKFKQARNTLVCLFVIGLLVIFLASAITYWVVVFSEPSDWFNELRPALIFATIMLSIGNVITFSYPIFCVSLIITYWLHYKFLNTLMPAKWWNIGFLVLALGAVLWRKQVISKTGED